MNGDDMQRFRAEADSAGIHVSQALAALLARLTEAPPPKIALLRSVAQATEEKLGAITAGLSKSGVAKAKLMVAYGKLISAALEAHDAEQAFVSAYDSKNNGGPSKN